MEVGLMKRQSCGTPNSNTNTNKKSSPPALGMHKDSQMMSKVKPKIRIIHIFAPEIIKTDVANFRELVQRLTGKPTSENTTTKRKRRNISRTSSSSEDERLRSVYNSKPVAPAVVAPNKLEIRTGFRPAELRERIKGEEEIWGGANSGGGFLGGFADLEYGFMQELTAFSLDATATHMDAYGSESQLA